MKKEWFEDWFDTSYYHILYQNRNDEEARMFIHSLIDDLNLPKGVKVLDLACGKGRHSITLNKLGYNVLGVDLSPNSIETARKHSNEHLSFEVHDMRNRIEGHKFSAIFNLFTSFGYFNDEKDNLAVLTSANYMLEENGLLLIDFMNVTKVIREMKPEETKTVDNIDFHISKYCDMQHIFKEIKFEDEGRDFHYTERVQVLPLAKFEELLQQADFKILRTFGDFNLSAFDESTSDRLIILAQKK